MHTVTAVRLNVSFVYHIYAFIVGNLQHYRIGRIVRRTHCVDVEFFHQRYVGFELLGSHYVAVGLMRIVVIYALNLYWHIVEIEDVAVDFNMSESNFLTYALNALFSLFYLNIQRIKVGDLRAPKFWIRHRKFTLVADFCIDKFIA